MGEAGRASYHAQFACAHPSVPRMRRTTTTLSPACVHFSSDLGSGRCRRHAKTWAGGSSAQDVEHPKATPRPHAQDERRGAAAHFASAETSRAPVVLASRGHGGRPSSEWVPAAQAARHRRRLPLHRRCAVVARHVDTGRLEQGPVCCVGKRWQRISKHPLARHRRLSSLAVAIDATSDALSCSWLARSVAQLCAGVHSVLGARVSNLRVRQDVGLRGQAAPGNMRACLEASAPGLARSSGFAALACSGHSSGFRVQPGRRGSGNGKQQCTRPTLEVGTGPPEGRGALAAGGRRTCGGSSDRAMRCRCLASVGQRSIGLLL